MKVVKTEKARTAITVKLAMISKRSDMVRLLFILPSLLLKLPVHNTPFRRAQAVSQVTRVVFV